jgi:hypothetical protein
LSRTFLLPGIASGRPRRASRCGVIKNFQKAWLTPALIPRRASRCGVNVSKTWPLPVFIPTARFASWRAQERFKNLAFASVKTYGACRVILSPLAIRGTKFYFFEIFALQFCFAHIDLLLL